MKQSIRLLSCLLLPLLILLPVLVGCNQSEEKPLETENPAMNTPLSDPTSVLTYGATGSGETDDTEAFKTAITEAKTGLVIPAGKYILSSSILFELPVRIEPGALLVTEKDCKLTFEKHLDAGLYRIFSGDGDVVLKNNPVAYPEWFGAKNDGKTDCTEAIQAAIDCYPSGGGRVDFQQGSYSVKDTITITQSHMTLSGYSRQTRELAPMIVSKHATKPVLHLLGKSGGNPYDGGPEDVTIQYLEFTRTEMDKEGSDTILLENTIYTTIQHTGFAHSQNGVRAVNVNGLRLLTVHATTGGDLPGKEVRGVYIDGSKRGSTGILINDFIYYAYGSPKAITYGYKDEAFEGANGGSVGDRRISNFECDGSCDYGIYLKSAGDFACDISIAEFTMDGIDTCGIYLEANNAYNWQQVNITNAYFRLANESGKACGITAKNFAFVHATNCHVDNAGGKNNGICFYNSYGHTITASSFSGGQFKSAILLDKASNCVINGNTSNMMGTLTLRNSNNVIISSNVLPSFNISQSGGSKIIIENNIIN